MKQKINQIKYRILYNIRSILFIYVIISLSISLILALTIIFIRDFPRLILCAYFMWPIIIIISGIFLRKISINISDILLPKKDIVVEGLINIEIISLQPVIVSEILELESFLNYLRKIFYKWSFPLILLNPLFFLIFFILLRAYYNILSIITPYVLFFNMFFLASFITIFSASHIIVLETSQKLLACLNALMFLRQSPEVIKEVKEKVPIPWVAISKINNNAKNYCH